MIMSFKSLNFVSLNALNTFCDRGAIFFPFKDSFFKNAYILSHSSDSIKGCIFVCQLSSKKSLNSIMFIG